MYLELCFPLLFVSLRTQLSPSGLCWEVRTLGHRTPSVPLVQNVVQASSQAHPGIWFWWKRPNVGMGWSGVESTPLDLCLPSQVLGGNPTSPSFLWEALSNLFYPESLFWKDGFLLPTSLVRWEGLQRWTSSLEYSKILTKTFYFTMVTNSLHVKTVSPLNPTPAKHSGWERRASEAGRFPLSLSQP